MKANHLGPAAGLLNAVAASLINAFRVRGVRGQRKSPGVRLPQQLAMLPSLAGATRWLNSKPRMAADLQGKVVLFDFWTYTCINSIRHTPYVRAWAEKYKDEGLVVIGVHSPGFEFERDIRNVRRAAGEMKIDYPILIDNDHAVWHAFGNEYWPALYFVDRRGSVRHHQIGEGNYEKSERVIQQLLAEGRGGQQLGGLVWEKAQGVEVGADWGRLRSQETYIGSERARNFSRPGPAAIDTGNTHSSADRLRLNEWTLSGDWTLDRQAAVLNQAHGRISFRFHARDVHLVMGPTTPDSPVRFRLLIESQPPGAAHGSDVDAWGNGKVTEHRLYQLIRQQSSIADRTLEIEYFNPGVEAFVFMFG